MVDEASAHSDEVPAGIPTRHRLEIRYSVPDLWITPDLLGHTYSYPREDPSFEIKICFPGSPNDFIPQDEPETVCIPSARRVHENGASAFGVNVMLVVVLLNGVGSAAQKERLGRSGFDDLQRIIGPSWQAATDAAEVEFRHFLSWFRVTTRQTWLGLAGDRPMQYGRAHLFDDEAGTRLVSYGPEMSATAMLGDRALSVAASQRIFEALEDGRPAPVSEALLADAEYLLEGKESADAHRAVLAAAIASEIQLKFALRTSSLSTNPALAKLVLNRQSDIGALSSTVAFAVTGRDLKTENPSLHKQIRALATRRNTVVHEGAATLPDEARPLVVAARQLFDWLDDLYAGDGRSESPQ